MQETFAETIDYWRIRRFVHGFQHDMNDAHDFVPHASVIAISQLDHLFQKKDEEARKQTEAEIAKEREQAKREIDEAREITSEDEFGQVEDFFEDRLCQAESWLRLELEDRTRRRKEEFVDAAGRVIKQGIIVSPGVLHLSMLEHHIPSDMIIASVSTKFADALYVPFSGEGIDVEIEKSEEPFVAEGKETPGRVYTFRMMAPGLFSGKADLFGRKGCRMVVFPDNIPPHQIAGYFKNRFTGMIDNTRDAIDSAGKDTNITHEHDSYYWSSIRPSALPRESELPPPVRRGGNISQLELLAKLPRVLSLYREKLESKRPSYLEHVEATEPYHAYAGLEKSLGKVDDVGKRARQLANGMMYIYGKQDAVFDPWVECPFDKYFTLTTFLIKRRGSKNVFVSQMMLPTGCAYVDTSMFFAAPAIPERVMKLLYDRKIDVNTMKSFE